VAVGSRRRRPSTWPAHKPVAKTPAPHGSAGDSCQEASRRSTGLMSGRRRLAGGRPPLSARLAAGMRWPFHQKRVVPGRRPAPAVQQPSSTAGPGRARGALRANNRAAARAARHRPTCTPTRATRQPAMRPAQPDARRSCRACFLVMDTKTGWATTYYTTGGRRNGQPGLAARRARSPPRPPTYWLRVLRSAHRLAAAETAHAQLVPLTSPPAIGDHRTRRPPEAATTSPKLLQPPEP